MGDTYSNKHFIVVAYLLPFLDEDQNHTTTLIHAYYPTPLRETIVERPKYTPQVGSRRCIRSIHLRIKEGEVKIIED